MQTIKVDYSKKLGEEPETGHNRWHPDIAPVLRVGLGEEVEIDTRDAFDGQFSAESDASDVLAADFNLVHPLTGPVFIEGAEPGDVLEINVLEVRPDSWGYTAQVPGFGFLRELFPEPYLAIWKLEGGYATSEALPGVRIPDGSFLGTIGVAPSAELRAKMYAREEELRARGGVVLPPEPTGAVPSSDAIASEGLRTAPPRENGGNMDIKQLSAGARLLLPVFVEGALFSVGDAHFAQGDGESCGTAIEMSSTARLSFGLRKGEAARRDIRFPRFEREDYYNAPEMAAPKRFIATTGISLRGEVNESEEATLAARNALVAMIEELTERGWTRQQAYAICSVAVDLRISELVDVPNIVVSAFLPLDIFEG